MPGESREQEIVGKQFATNHAEACHSRFSTFPLPPGAISDGFLIVLF